MSAEKKKTLLIRKKKKSLQNENKDMIFYIINGLLFFL